MNLIITIAQVLKISNTYKINSGGGYSEKLESILKQSHSNEDRAM
jgi:hypothetical protein